MDFDLVIRGGTVVAAADVGKSDVGVKDGRIVALAEDLPGAASEIDASGLLVLPGGIDSHVHFDQPQGPGDCDGGRVRKRHSQRSGGRQHHRDFIRAAAARTIVAPERRELSRKGEGQVLCRLRIPPDRHGSDATGGAGPGAARRSSAPAIQAFKVFMTYDNMVLTDRQLLEVFTVAREQGATVMVHAEGYDQIKYMTDRLERDGKTHPYFHAEDLGPSSSSARRPTARSRMRSCGSASRSPLIVHVSGREGRWSRSNGRGRGLEDLCRDLPAISGADGGGPCTFNMDFSGAKYVCSPPPRVAWGEAICVPSHQRRVPDFLLGPLSFL